MFRIRNKTERELQISHNARIKPYSYIEITGPLSPTILQYKTMNLIEIVEFDIDNSKTLKSPATTISDAQRRRNEILKEIENGNVHDSFRLDKENVYKPENTTTTKPAKGRGRKPKK